jgi:hypothetical protein
MKYSFLAYCKVKLMHLYVVDGYIHENRNFNNAGIKLISE